jgi:hypothetical protein
MKQLLLLGADRHELHVFVGARANVHEFGRFEIFDGFGN